MLPGARYHDPEFSWKFEVAPAGLGFARGGALGPAFEGTMVVGAARAPAGGGYLFRFRLTRNRLTLDLRDRRLRDRVADNACKFDLAQSNSLLIGRDFGIATDVETGPNGNLFVVSLDKGAIYEVHRPPR